MRLFRTASILVLLAALAAAFALALQSDTALTALRFAALRHDHTALRQFLYRMPKGGDLHVHLSGAIYAESYIAWAAEVGLCLQLPQFAIVDPPCDPKDKPAVADALNNQDLYDRVVNALSVRGFLPTPGVPSAHDQFFDAFPKFGVIAYRNRVTAVAALLNRYAAQNVQYVELMASFAPPELSALAHAIEDKTDFAEMLETLRGLDLANLVADAAGRLANDVAEVSKLLGCGTEKAQPGCAVTFRYIAQIQRNAPPFQVFAQLAFAVALIPQTSALIGLNFVQPEDYLVARRDYSLHMQMVRFLASAVPVALHAGELWLGLVPPEDLRFHIREAVTVAGARRIGHGVSLAFERDADGLLAEMRRHGVAVEINLTSNDLILGVRGRDHPLPAYLAAGVPVVLSTDDEGVARIDLTNEYFRAARDYGLAYLDLKAIARNALIHSFLQPEEKQKELDRLDRAFVEFEQSVAQRGWTASDVSALSRSVLSVP